MFAWKLSWRARCRHVESGCVAHREECADHNSIKDASPYPRQPRCLSRRVPCGDPSDRVDSLHLKKLVMSKALLLGAVQLVHKYIRTATDDVVGLIGKATASALAVVCMGSPPSGMAPGTPQWVCTGGCKFSSPCPCRCRGPLAFLSSRSRYFQNPQNGNGPLTAC